MSGGNNGKVLTVSRKLAKILTDSRKSHHPIETLKVGIILKVPWLLNIQECNMLKKKNWAQVESTPGSWICDYSNSGN